MILRRAARGNRAQTGNAVLRAQFWRAHGKGGKVKRAAEDGKGGEETDGGSRMVGFVESQARARFHGMGRAPN
jgi:hypothetical protein